MALTKAEARLEALKLAVRPGLEVTSILQAAEDYYAFIVQDEAVDAARGAPAKAKVKP